MRLLLITSSYPDADEGQAAAGSFVADFARALTQQDISVTVLAPALRDRITVEQQVKVHRFSVPRLPLSLLNPNSPSNWPPILKTIRTGSRMAIQAVREEKIDHIHALWVLPSGWWAMQAAIRQNIPFSTWALGSDIWTLAKIPIARNILRHILRKAAFRFADGIALARDVERISGGPCSFLPSSRIMKPSIKKRLRVKPPYRLTYLGRWHPNKGVDLLLQTLEMFDDEDWRMIDTVRICGGGPLDLLVRNHVERLSSSARPVTLTGYMSQRCAEELLAWTDYILIPSRIESIPVIFSDAMQMACPVIAMPVGDLPNLVRRLHVGAVAKDISPFAYADAIRRALREGPATFATGLHNASRSFSVNASVQNFIAKISFS